MSELILGLDIGTTSLKAAVFDHSGAQKGPPPWWSIPC
jgi:sugar (pentulose or hexulose) kinase